MRVAFVDAEWCEWICRAEVETQCGSVALIDNHATNPCCEQTAAAIRISIQTLESIDHCCLYCINVREIVFCACEWVCGWWDLCIWEWVWVINVLGWVCDCDCIDKLLWCVCLCIECNVNLRWGSMCSLAWIVRSANKCVWVDWCCFQWYQTSRRHSDRLKTEGNSPAVLLKQPGTSDICINWKSETSIMCHCLIQSLRVQHIRQLHNMITLKHNVIFRVSNIVEKKTINATSANQWCETLYSHLYCKNLCLFHFCRRWCNLWSAPKGGLQTYVWVYFVNHHHTLQVHAPSTTDPDTILAAIL
jgi:hypothetical protein